MKNRKAHEVFGRLTEFLRHLREAKIAYTLRDSREDAIMIRINVPGERWEAEFLQDGDVEIERFISSGEVEDASALNELFAKFSDKEAPVHDNASTG